MKVNFLAAFVLIAGIAVWWQYTSAPEKLQLPPSGTMGSDDRSTTPAADPDLSVEPSLATIRSQASADPEAPPQEKQPPPWLGKLEVIPGQLSPQDLDTALSYVIPTIQITVERLSQRVFDSTSAEDLEAEADMLADIELLQARETKLRQGDYFILRESPRSWKAPKGMRFEAFPAFMDGKLVSIGFVFDRETSPRLFDTTEYASELSKHNLREAARSFNSRDYEERRRLIDQYNEIRKTRSWEQMPDEIRRIFPNSNHVDNNTLLMRAR